MERKLFKSDDNKVLAGVCGGVGEYFDVDPVIIRLLVVIFTLMGGAGLIAYIIAAIIIPDKNVNRTHNTNTYENQESSSNENGTSCRKNGRGSSITLGIILIIFGGFILLKDFIPWVPREVFLATILIGLGVYFLVKKNR